MSSTVGEGCRSRWMARLGSRMSTHTRTSLGIFGFGAATIGLTHGVGPVASSIISFSSSRFNSSATLFLRWKGILLSGCAIGGTLGSIQHHASCQHPGRGVHTVLREHGYWQRWWLSSIWV